MTPDVTQTSPGRAVNPILRALEVTPPKSSAMESVGSKEEKYLHGGYVTWRGAANENLMLSVRRSFESRCSGFQSEDVLGFKR